MVRALLPGEAEESGVVVAACDAARRQLWVERDRRVRTLTGDRGFVAGTNWSEAAVGTSAPGTAIALDRSVQIRRAEHFDRLVAPWSCTAAPVHDTETRRGSGADQESRDVIQFPPFPVAHLESSLDHLDELATSADREPAGTVHRLIS